MERKFLNANDEQLFIKSLKEWIDIIFSNRDFLVNEMYYESINSSIKSVETKIMNENEELGTTIYALDGTTKIVLTTTDIDIYPSIIKRTYNHEVLHSIISHLNYEKSGKINRSIVLNSINAKMFNYNGLLGAVDENEKYYSAGNALVELFVDFLAAYKTNNLNLNEMILNGIDNDESKTDYNNLFPLIRLLLVTFNNDIRFSYQEQVNTNGLLFSTVSTSGKNKMPRNILIDGILTNPIMISDEYNRLMAGDNAWFSLLYKLDTLFNTYNENMEIKVSDLQEIFTSIDDFAKKRYIDLLNNNFINDEEYNMLVGYYNNVATQFQQLYFNANRSL